MKPRNFPDCGGFSGYPNKIKWLKMGIPESFRDDAWGIYVFAIDSALP